MAKKKIKQQHTISPEKYMQTKVRNLPIEECLISEKWQETGECNLIIARKHASGNFTIGIFLIDLYCLGIKDCFYNYNIFKEEYDDLKNNDGLTAINYNEAHNIIYGVVAYAEDLGINPHKDFKITQYILEPDTDDIPLIEYEFGYNGKPFLIVNSRQEANHYLPALRKSVGDDFELIIREEDEDFFDLEKLEKMNKNLQKMQEKYDILPHTDYAYSYPDYPKKLKLNHEELNIFFSPDNTISLNKEDIDKILSFPRKTLVEDLKNIILFEIGQTCGEITDELWDKPYTAPIFHALLFLGELNADEGLDVVLEVMRQNESFTDYHFGDATNDIIPLTLYYIGKNQLPKLTEYAKEPGLYIFLKTYLFSAISMIAIFEPERRDEIINWFRSILIFYKENILNSVFYDATLAGMMMSSLLDINAEELLPEIEQLYSTGLVDEACCGNYQEIKTEMKSKNKPLQKYSLMNIYERYTYFASVWSK